MHAASGRFAGQVALITGAAQGIGAAAARGFAAGGGCVLLADVQGLAVASLAEELGDKARSVRLDVVREEDWQAAIAAVLDHFGRLTHLFNVAGISEPGNVESTAPDQWARTMEINLTGPYLGCRTAIPAMVASGADCAIVNVGSMLALRPSAAFAAYSASKAGLAALTKSVALHCAARGYAVRVNAVHPGGTQTPMLEAVLDALPQDRAVATQSFADKLPMKRLGTADEVADAILFLASDAARFTIGTDLTVDGGGSYRE